MGASFLSKFARGAAGTGAVLFADSAKAEMLAKLTTKRDAVLNANRQAATQQSQEFTLERDASLETSRQAATTTATETQAGIVDKAQQARLDMQDDRHMDALEQQQAKHELDIIRDAKKPSAASKAKKGLTDSQKVTLLSNLMTNIEEEQSSLSVTNPMNKAEIKEEAKRRFHEIIEIATSGGKTSGGLVTVSTQAEYDKLKSGQEYINAKTGELRTKQ